MREISLNALTKRDKYATICYIEILCGTVMTKPPIVEHFQRARVAGNAQIADDRVSLPNRQPKCFAK